ncbi:helix-turn-helix domain-containing protein [Sphingomonas sp. HHU CXW]|uniref:Helix-turn-helix domain-containing protein n=1 Tax=Sphingomonas hominis TaxID=2741495 RepID=A0ABX2JCA1_9SPHN|nr:helix-turn-helix transcriptional regulator [Sphingomonas hominis]NTS63785.1 helix-turn-helix domain-containing protein [Sphingomonas hominis]
MPGNHALGEFLRSRRTRLPPSDAARTRRRTPGLKREEVAQRAGISVEWYVKLEQGRGVSPSPGTVDALARALMLDPAETTHLRALADTAPSRTFDREVVPDLLRALVAGMAEPAYVTGRRFDVLAWNAAASALFGDFAHLADDDRNILHWMLTNPAALTLFGDGWSDEARRVVDLFRVSHDLWRGDPAFTALVARVRAASPSFASWWDDHNIRAPRSGIKRLHHPVLGPVSYAHASFQANDDPSLRLTIYTRA